MQKLAATLALLCMGTSAIAADMAVKAPSSNVAAVNDWTGFYIGGHGGYGRGNASVDFAIDPFTDPKPTGYLYGGQAGYNWQRGVWVTGLEIDYSFANIKETQTSVNKIAGDVPLTVTTTLESKLDALASARAKLGLLISPDILAYGTGGLGWGKSTASIGIDSCGAKPPCDNMNTSAVANNFGWVAGAGLQFKLAPTVLVRAEYLHYDFGKTHYAFPIGTGTPIDVGVNAKLNVDVIRGGVDFRF